MSKSIKIFTSKLPCYNAAIYMQTNDIILVALVMDTMDEYVFGKKAHHKMLVLNGT